MIPAVAGFALAWLLDSEEEPRHQLADLFNTDPRLRKYVEARGRWNGSPHWIWTGAKQKGGRAYKGGYYGRLRRGSRLWLAHRYVYRLLVGSIPPDHHVHHACGESLCVNPAHIEAIHEDKHQELHTELEAERELARERAA